MRTLAPHGLIAVVALGLALGVPPEAAGAQGAARVQCQVSENGRPAVGTLVLRQGDRQVATGSCGGPLAAPAGSYVAEVRLDGTLDEAKQTSTVTLRAGATETVTADFSTAILEVSATAAGHPAAAMARIFKDGQLIGTLASGVQAHLGIGTYSVVVKHRTTEQRFDGVSLGRSDRRVLSVSFD